jgi:hypothetical protein
MKQEQIFDLLYENKAYEFRTGDKSNLIKRRVILNKVQNGNFSLLNHQQVYTLKNNNILSNLYTNEDILNQINKSIFAKKKQLINHSKVFSNLNLVIYFFEYSISTLFISNPSILLRNIVIDQELKKVLTNIYILFSKEMLSFDLLNNVISYKKSPIFN